MTQNEEMTSKEFQIKWMIVYYEMDGVKIFQNRLNPQCFCRISSIGEWVVWKTNPRTGFRYDSTYCTFEYLMENY